MERYAFGVGRARFPGMDGPYPTLPELYCAPKAAPIIPCHLEAKPTISNFPVKNFAIRMAASLLSPPVLRKNALSNPGGVRLVSRFAREITGGLSMPLKR